ncbi:MAG: shikimate dehydrogenase [Nitrosopumilus sp.]|nr:shikimate dehydrogenase [Nitrosopumilus sp.]MDA7942900.1 shikimate dehydrogenase [Nitrosopumilus sp.]MDA7953306.1 shikimate dehydrogenase [Nitrosopumilus sp.]MDA7958468.1 shikimate dehydrogenase [Nitrosopumilus sp.]MDA7959241.1 shikimate dehydrogenase [Nitrosopumilus sp.]
MSGTYAVIGDPIDHSLSPAIHNAAFRHLGMDCSYIAYRVPRGELEEGVAGLREAGIAGFNVTIPHKEGIMRMAEPADEECRMAGAANTVTVGDVMTCHNTDVAGFMEPIEGRGIDVSGMSVVVHGSGGAARAAVVGLSRAGARVSVAARSARGAAALRDLASEMGSEPGGSPEMIVNATPVGMDGVGGSIPLGGAGPGTTVYDMVYRPPETRLVRDARKAGCTVILGYEMLLAQAARSFRIWHKRDAPRDVMRSSLLGGSP